MMHPPKERAYHKLYRRIQLWHVLMVSVRYGGADLLAMEERLTAMEPG
jgi:hypothetical protein